MTTAKVVENRHKPHHRTEAKAPFVPEMMVSRITLPLFAP